jgi:hypothetical protein
MNTPSISSRKLLIAWILTCAVAVPLAWMAYGAVQRPLGGLFLATILFGAQWLLLRLLRIAANWTAVMVSNGGPITGFEATIQTALSQLPLALALVFLTPILLGSIIVVSFSIVWIPLGLGYLLNITFGEKEERQPRLHQLRRRMERLVGQLVRWYGVYIVGAVAGAVVALALNLTFGPHLLANDAYLGPVLVRVLEGALVGWYSWLVTTHRMPRLLAAAEEKTIANE